MMSGEGASRGIYVLDVERGVANQVSRDANVSGWHPRLDTLLVMMTERQIETVRTVRADGSGESTRMFPDFSQRHSVAVYAPDGEQIVFQVRVGGGNSDLWTAAVGGDPKSFIETPFEESGATFSPDGRYLAFVSDRTGRPEVYVRDFPSNEQEWVVSADGGSGPRWAANGELFYRDGDRMMRVVATTEPEFRADRPEVLFEGIFSTTPSHLADYDVTSDGERFVMRRDDPVERRRIHVSLDWFAELERLVPTN